ncbi:hypothetical protein ABIC94_001061 [Variovorax paradoxus]|jgi:hypothetical protein|uniref:hypothetical protein n=1 Tax=Variovorax paradoxus TaxID=34073 RepID=UPI00339A27CD
MKNTSQLFILCAISMAVLSGCQSVGSKVGEAQVGVDAQCVVTPAGYAHIFARHCTAASGASQLLPQYCTNAAAAQTFCRMVQNAPNQYRIVQPDNRIRYDSNLNQIVGTAGEKCGRLVIETNGTVVTEFPEFAGAPGNCR